MNFNEFHNAVRILCWNIERNEVGFMTSGQWLDFQRNPTAWFVRANDADAHRIFAIIEARQPKWDKPGDDVDDLINEVLLHVDDDPEPPTFDEALGAKADADARYVRDMMDAGRGHLVRK